MARIMIVDDNHQNRLVAAGFLEDEHELLVLESGGACLENLNRFEPDVILMDWMMPGLNGLQTLGRIREQPRHRNVRIIMLTAKAQPGDITRAWRAGANDYIPKPFEMSELLESVDRQTREKKRRDDMDERWREMEDGIRQAQKMEALGCLAGGIAHDFNNILFPIQAFAELLSDHPDPEVADGASEIRTAAKRAGKLVGQILSFSRQSRQDLLPVAAHIIVKEALNLIRASFPANIRIRTDIRPDCKMVLADPTTIHQVVMNLCTNAKHAMEETGGTLFVRLRTLPPDPALAGDFVELEVKDTGCGIAPEIFDKVFKPFFTTKAPGKGTGMGLPLVKGIIEGLGGTIELDSRPGKETCFRILLPSTGDDGLPREERLQDIVGGKERILVVDDEPLIAEMLEKTLRSLGYEVRAYTNAPRALNAVPQGFDLMITDMTMPEMTGVDLAQKAWALRRNLPVILMTGFSEAANLTRAQNIGIREMLFKPVGRGDIAAAVRRALNAVNADNYS